MRLFTLLEVHIASFIVLEKSIIEKEKGKAELGSRILKKSISSLKHLRIYLNCLVVLEKNDQCLKMTLIETRRFAEVNPNVLTQVLERRTPNNCAQTKYVLKCTNASFIVCG